MGKNARQSAAQRIRQPASHLSVFWNQAGQEPLQQMISVPTDGTCTDQQKSLNRFEKSNYCTCIVWGVLFYIGDSDSTILPSLFFSGVLSLPNKWSRVPIISKLRQLSSIGPIDFFFEQNKSGALFMHVHT